MSGWGGGGGGNKIHMKGFELMQISFEISNFFIINISMCFM
jgi:hypothetical protein